MKPHYDGVVIGAGVFGSAITLELARRGRRTLCVDKLPAAGYGSTSNSCAIVRTHYSTPEGTALAWESYLRWKEWADYLGADDERGLAHLNETGLVVVRTRGHGYELHLTYHDALGIPYEVWTPKELEERVPFFDSRSFYPPRLPDDDRFGEQAESPLIGAVYFPRAGYVNDPQLAAHNLQRAAEAQGAEFRFNIAVDGVRRASGRVTGIELADGSLIPTPVVVNAAGPHSLVVNRMAGVEDDMTVTTRALRREVHYLPFPGGTHPEGYGRIATDDDVGVYCRAAAGGMMLVGSLDPECDAPDWVEDPDSFDREVTSERWRAQVYRAALRIPGLSIPSRPKGIADLYDVTEDWIPIYDRSSLGGFYLAVGTSGNQFKNSHIAAYCMLKLIQAVEEGHDHDADPVKVEMPYTRLEMDMSAFSRNREINRASSFSVLG